MTAEKYKSIKIDLPVMGPRTYFSNFEGVLVELEWSLSPHFNEHEVNFHMHVEKVKKNYQKVVKIYLKVGPRIEKLIISQWGKLNEALELLSDED